MPSEQQHKGIGGTELNCYLQPSKVIQVLGANMEPIDDAVPITDDPPVITDMALPENENNLVIFLQFILSLFQKIVNR